MPISARLDVFNPLVPADPEASGLPVAFIDVTLRNETSGELDVAVTMNLENFVGSDGAGGAPFRNRNEPHDDGGMAGLQLGSDGVAPTAEGWGTIALAMRPEGSLSRRTGWARRNWGGSLLDFWDDLLADGQLDDRPNTIASGPSVEQHDSGPIDAPVASVAETRRLGPGESTTFRVVVAWHFPNRRAWAVSGNGNVNDYGDAIIGNLYTTRFPDAWAAAHHAMEHRAQLEADTLRFVSALCEADLPAVVREAALNNLSTLRTQTCFRTPDGHLFGWEGCHDRTGSCLGSCTHVWNYEQATGYLFGSLARSMREVDLLHATRDDGHMSFRVLLPLETHAQDWGLAAADGQMGSLMRLYREWQLSGDDAFLRRLWPKARAALEFCWVPGGWDADRDGVMEGCQHNTMDVEYYGPNPQMGIWYLGALRAMEEMAAYLGETAFARECRALFERGRDWVDANLFNGEYYEHQVRPPVNAAAIAPGLRHDHMGARDLTNPELQLGSGCLVDQLVGQYMAHVLGLGDLIDRDHARTTLGSIMRHNFRSDLSSHFNHMRSYALQDEAALLMATYPRGGRPERPFPYFNEVMTGFEYTVAAHLLYEDQDEDGLRVVSAIRDRYDGERRNPFDEAECGHHYARAMASWAMVLALTGFHYSGVTGTLSFRPVDTETRWFWSSGDAWGTVRQTPGAGRIAVELSVLGGALRLERLCLSGFGEVAVAGGVRGAGETANLSVART